MPRTGRSPRQRRATTVWDGSASRVPAARHGCGGPRHYPNCRRICKQARPPRMGPAGHIALMARSVRVFCRRAADIADIELDVDFAGLLEGERGLDLVALREWLADVDEHH